MIEWRNEKRRLGDLVPWQRNPRKIDGPNAKRLAESAAEFGQPEVLAVGPNDELYNGHQRLSTWLQAYGPDHLVDVRVSDRPLTEREREKLTVYLHRGATGAFDFDVLLAEFNYNDLVDWGFDPSELNFSPVVEADEPKDAEPQESKADELQAHWGTAAGQIWRIGDHRLACGDCSDRGLIAALTQGERAELLLCDPPYGVERDKGFGGAAAFGGGDGAAIKRREYADTWDSERPSAETFASILELARAAIIWGGNFFADTLPQSKHWLVWDKLNTMPSFGDCELAWTNVDRHSVKKYTVQYNGLIGKEKERFHPTQKPVALMLQVMGDYTDAGDLVIDTYGGSGPVMLAAQNLGRRCYTVELSPAYCAVMLQRMADAFPDLQIERLQ